MNLSKFFSMRNGARCWQDKRIHGALSLPDLSNGPQTISAPILTPKSAVVAVAGVQI